MVYEIGTGKFIGELGDHLYLTSTHFVISEDKERITILSSKVSREVISGRLHALISLPTGISMPVLSQVLLPETYFSSIHLSQSPNFIQKCNSHSVCFWNFPEFKQEF